MEESAERELGLTGRGLRLAIAEGNFNDLPSGSAGRRFTLEEQYEAVVEAGYSAVQSGNPKLCRRFGLALLGAGVLASAEGADNFANYWADRGAVLATCIAGFGHESEEEADRIVEALQWASLKTGLPIYLETHRASITQDAWRSVQLLNRHPSLRLTLDFSHWFTGQEMQHGDMAARLDFLEPVFKRTALLHGRVGNRCCMQVPLVSEQNGALPVFQEVWRRAMRHAKLQTGPGAFYFCVELLGIEYQYARIFRIDGAEREESDRWTEALALKIIAEECWKAVKLT